MVKLECEEYSVKPSSMVVVARTDRLRHPAAAAGSRRSSIPVMFWAEIRRSLSEPVHATHDIICRLDAGSMLLSAGCWLDAEGDPLARDSQAALVALNRFGLGARGG